MATPARPGFPARIDLGQGGKPPAKAPVRAPAAPGMPSPVTNASAPQAASMARDPIPARARMV
ncbi:MAG TPA: hypothetical protein PK947_16090 [Ottowia sp.]|nr:hypothetical protein [Ottowia sp.]